MTQLSGLNTDTLWTREHMEESREGHTPGGIPDGWSRDQPGGIPDGWSRDKPGEGKAPN